MGGPSYYVFAQDNSEELAAKPTIPAGAEQHDRQDLEQLLKRYNTDAEKVINDTSIIHETDPLKSEMSDSEINEMSPYDIIEKRAHSLASKNSKEMSLSDEIRIPLSKFQGFSEDELLKLLMENTKDSKFEPYMDRFPKFTLLMVRLIKDKEAIPSVVKIVENKDRLTWFTGVMISTFLLGFLLKRIMRKEGRSILGSIGNYMVRVLIMTVVRFMIIMYFFREELTPAFNIVNKTFL